MKKVLLLSILTFVTGCIAHWNSLGSPAPAPTVDHFGLRDGMAQIHLGVVPERRYAIQASSDLRNWTDIFRGSAPGGLLVFETELGFFTTRFFRAMVLGDEAEEGPINDLFLNRIPLTGSSVRVTASNAEAGTEAGEPGHAHFDHGSGSVWWTWTAPGNGRATVSTIGSYFDTLVAVYTGPSVDALTTIAKRRFLTKQIAFDATAGTSYHIAVDGNSGESGEIQLRVTLEPHQPGGPPEQIGGVTVVLNESEPNVPVRLIRIAPDGQSWSEFDHGKPNLVDAGKVIAYETSGTTATLVLDADPAEGIKVFEYTFDFTSASSGVYSYIFDGWRTGNGRFADFRSAMDGLAPAALKGAGLLMTRLASSTGVAGQSHYFTLGITGDFHDADGGEHGLGIYSYETTASEGKLRLNYEAPGHFAGDHYEIDLTFETTTEGRFTGAYVKNDGTSIDLEGIFLVEYLY